MHEQADDIAALQFILDQSYASSGKHLNRIFRNQLAAEDVVSELGGIFEMHLATTTSRGAPLVAPIDGLFYRGQIWFGVPAAAARGALIRRDPRVSASFTRGESFGFIVHGQAIEVRSDDPLYSEYQTYSDGEYTKLYGEKWLDWRDKQHAASGPGDLWRIDARKVFVKR